jgi:hypothetical protein
MMKLFLQFDHELKDGDMSIVNQSIALCFLFDFIIPPTLLLLIADMYGIDLGVYVQAKKLSSETNEDANCGNQLYIDSEITYLF